MKNIKEILEEDLLKWFIGAFPEHEEYFRKNPPKVVPSKRKKK